MKKNEIRFQELLSRDLTEALDKHLSEEFNRIHLAQKKLAGFEGNFLMNNVIYVEGGTTQDIGGIEFTKLDPTLLEKFKDWENYSQDLKFKWERAKQILGSCLARARSFQDLRDMLPDYIWVSYSSRPELKHLERTRKSLEDDDGSEYGIRLVQMFKSIAPTLHFMAGIRIL